MKKRIILALVILNILGILALAFVQWGWIFKHSDLNAEAKKFKNNLLETLDESIRVEIVEHSWHYDFGGSDNQSIELPYFEYKRIRLSKDQENEFRKIFNELSRKPRTDFLPCAFAPHHTIEIYNREEEKKVVKVCFECGDTSWGETKTITPARFQSVFFKFIKPLGFKAERDWGTLARERREDLKTD